jgi:hypothetical protein
MVRGRTAARAVVAALPLATWILTVSAETVVDGFETEALGSHWWLRAGAGRVIAQWEIVRSGRRSALRVGGFRDRMAHSMVVDVADFRTERLAE